jgi:hypothetical protein
MTTYIDFAPSTTSNFQFNATLDGQTYTVTVTWNVFGARYYVNITQVDGTLVLAIPLIESPDSYDISMVAGYFASTLVYRESTGQFEVNP